MKLENFIRKIFLIQGWRKGCTPNITWLYVFLKKTSKLQNYHLNRLKNFEFVETNVFTQNWLENKLKFSF
jgi:hypothetical protein